MSIPRRNVQPALLVLYSAAYLIATGIVCRDERLWFDELITAYVARLSSVRELWRCLLEATDSNPPLYHLAVRASVGVLGDGPLALRVPAMLGVWVYSLCIFRYVGLRCGWSYGWTALFLVLATGAGPYAHEARPYGLVLAGCGIALVGWQAAAGAGPRWSGLVATALGLAVGVTSHYYAVLLVVPLAAGELARTIERRRIDVPVWIAFVVGLSALLPCLPLMAPIRAYAQNFWSKPEAVSIPQSYRFVVEPAGTALALVLLGLGGLVLGGARDGGGDGTAAGPPRHELVATLTLLAYPLLTLALAAGVTGAFVDRYVLPASAGFAIAFAYGAHRLVGGSRQAGVALAFLALLGAVAARLDHRVRDQERFNPLELMIQPLALATEPAPILVCDSNLYLQLMYYAPRSVTARLLYLVPARPNTAEAVLGRLQRWAPLRLERFQEYLDTRPRGSVVYLYGRTDDWLANTMPMVCERMEVRYLDVRRMLARVTLK